MFRMLARAAGEIRVGDVVRALDGMLAPIGCASKVYYRRCEDCDSSRPCGVQVVMAQARDAIASVLDACTLSDLRKLGGLEAI